MRPQRKAQEGGQRNLVFRAPVALHDRFREVAEADHRTVSQELRRLMEQRIAEADELKQAA
jgi:Arc-like DNA binding dprotein